MSKPLTASRQDVWLLDGVRTPCVDYNGGLVQISPIDLGIKAAREAFGAQVMACARALSLDEDKLNVNGGAIAIGHPLGATGVRLSFTVARELRRSGPRYGIASVCIGGGQDIALLIENPDATSTNRKN